MSEHPQRIDAESPERISLVLPDGKSLTLPRGSTPLDAARSIGARLADAAVGAELEGGDVDLRQPLLGGGRFRVFTAKDPEAGRFVRHSAEHVMADAVKRLWPEVEIDVGRVDHSEKFQYDFRRAQPFTPEDLARIESKMREILAEGSVFERIEISRQEAASFFAERGEGLKVKRLEDIPLDETITLYRHGDFYDLCRGPHVRDLGQIGTVKLLEASAVYWKGDEANERLQRVYGTAFSTERELEEYERRVEEAAARDHRRLGPQLDLWSMSPHAPASPFFHPAGALVYNQLVDFIRELYAQDGYGEVVTPQIMDVELWKQSGHYDYYGDAMFFTEAEGRQFAVKPMNCPGACLVYQTRLRSYRDLPIRYSDFGRLHRAERSGVITGLTRVRTFCQDDAHIFCTEDQVESEVMSVVRRIREIYEVFGFGEVAVEVSTRPQKAVGTAETWERAQATLRAVLERNGISYTPNPGEGAFYAPKIDFQVKDVMGRSWQLGTVQLDYQLPERFELKYTASSGEERQPVLIHRAMLGSLERFIGILVEHTGGALPLWLAPRQAVVLPVSERFSEYGASVTERLRGEGLRVELDDRGEKLGYRIREAQLQKTPYMLVVGGREAEAGTVAVRLRGGEDLGSMEVGALAERMREQIRSRSSVL
ncbi:MAG TPA: threonine--tRNA ligase [Thermoanaerobaculia bacterium]|nr:threonine--tRNA ligase [Thermoanaerobaculia bacterium]